jgi:hypothetical protein
MKNEKKLNNGIFYIVISLVACLTIGFSAVAYSISQSINVEGDYIYNEAENQLPAEEINLGATPGGDFYNPVVFHDSVIENGAFNIELNWRQATTTGDTDTIVLGKKQYTGSDTLVCSGSGNDSFIYFEGLVPYTATYRMGTTTPVNANYLLATTTQGIITGTEVATSTSLLATYGYTLNADDEEGDWARESFILETNDIVFVSLDFSTSLFSTSTMPTLATQGLTADGYAKLSCKKAE